MTAVDSPNVTGAITPANPTTGALITVTISGDDVLVETVTGTIGPLIAHCVALDGATFDITIDAAPYSKVTTTHESVKLVGITDPDGRTWLVATDGLTATSHA